MKFEIYILLSIFFLGCSQNQNHLEDRLEKLEIENSWLRDKLDLFEFHKTNPLDSASLHSNGCYLPTLMIDAPKHIILGDTFVATVYLSSTQHQVNLKTTPASDLKLGPEIVKHNRESITYKCVPSSKGVKIFRGNFIADDHRGLARYPFEFKYVVE
jgi:hypothetical protein